MKNKALSFALILAIRPIRYAIDSFSYKFLGGRKRSEEIRGYKDSLKGKPLLIVGNGPSLNQTPLDEFSKVFGIGMNKINLIFERSSWRPSLVISSNPLVTRQNSEFWRSSTIPVFLSWKNRWFVDRAVKKNVGFYLQTKGGEFSKDVSSGIGAGSTITYAAMQFAYYMGADPVILVGVDHTFALKASDKKGAIQKASGDDKSHFDPNYFGDGVWWQIPDLDHSEEAYAFANDAFIADNRKIYDATVGGKLEVFEKISIERAKELCGLQ